MRDSLADAVRHKYPPDKVIELLERHLASGDEKIALAAVTFLAERGYGKAPQVIEDERGSLSEDEYQDELRHIALEVIAKMTPEEKFKLLADTAPSGQVQ